FLCEKRMVIARGLLAQSGRGRGRARARPRAQATRSADGAEGPAAELAAYVPGLPDTTHLVIVEDELASVQPVLDARPDAVRRDFAPLRDDAIPGWLATRAKRYGARISQRAAHELAQLAGSDLRNLDHELAKLATYVEPGAEIGVDEVQQLVVGAAP